MLIFIICIIILFTHVDRWNIRNMPTRKNISHANDGAFMAPGPHWIRPWLLNITQRT